MVGSEWVANIRPQPGGAPNHQIKLHWPLKGPRDRFQGHTCTPRAFVQKHPTEG